ncbi:hypothetical protein M3Y96_00381000 [Aphelenchoides besseyi]|nr:hypothetical protein M3Y96_00381000 [Aphelenchoides besseyi]
METWIYVVIVVGAIAVAVVIGLFAIKRKLRGDEKDLKSSRPFREQVDATGKVVLITGANSGIGKQLAKELNKRGAKVYMLVRNVERGNEAVRDLVFSYGCDTSRLLVRECDLNSFKSVRRFFDNFENEEKHVDILVCNAGVAFVSKFVLTEDGYESTVQANHLGHFLLVELLLPKLQRAPQGRIVITSSRLHMANSCSLERMNRKEEFGPYQSYFRSKLANILHTVELSKRIRKQDPNSRVTVNVLHPGVVNTNLFQPHLNNNKFLNYLCAPYIYFFFKTKEDGAKTSLFVSLSQKISDVSGKYFDNSQIVDLTYHLAKDENLSREFYDECLNAVGRYLN